MIPAASFLTDTFCYKADYYTEKINIAVLFMLQQNPSFNNLKLHFSLPSAAA